MESETIAELIGADGRKYRATVTYDEFAGQPDGDCYGIILRRGDTWQDMTPWEVRHADSGMEPAAGEIAERLNVARDHGDADAERVALERLAVASHEFGSHVDRYAGRWLSVVTDDILTAWGCPRPVPADIAERPDWQAWLDGETYFIAVDVAVTWSADDDRDDMTTWEDVDSCGGYYGDDYAAESAREMLAEHAPADSDVTS